MNIELENRRAATSSECVVESIDNDDGSIQPPPLSPPTLRQTTDSDDISAADEEEKQSLIVKIENGSRKSVCSNESDTSSLKFMCRICHCEEGSAKTNLIRPCSCSGTLSYVHQSCLQKWLKISGSKKCELCHDVYILKTKLNPLRELKMLSLSSKEKKVLLLTNILYILGILCNFWSEINFLKLISDLVRVGNLNWKFYMILFLCVTTMFCIIWLLVLIGQVWYGVIVKFIRNNQSIVVVSKYTVV